MLKRRIIPVELLSGGRLIKPVAFGAGRDVGNPIKSSRVYSDQDADELVLLHIDRNHRDMDAFVRIVGEVATQCYVPLTAGGGVKAYEDARRLIEAGADKVLINSAAYETPQLLSDIAYSFGRQAVVVGVDVRVEGGQFTLYSECGNKRQHVSLEDHITAVESAGAGELFIQDIERDGAMAGYNIELVRHVVALSRVPVISGAGAGNFMHLKEAFDAGSDAVACGSLFNFGDNNPLRAKAFLKNYGIPLKRI
jgi:imidazole glycerol-phosphate synthase subunit HisF